MKNLFISIFFLACILSDNGTLLAQKWMWARNSVGIQPEEILSQVTDPAGNVYITGASTRGLFDTGNCVFFSGTSIISQERYYSFLVKNNPVGDAVWAKKIYASYVLAATDPFGNVFLTGIFNHSTFTIDGLTVNSQDPTDTLNCNVFIAKLDPSGKALWLRSGGGGKGMAINYTRAISSDKSGNVIVGGEMYTTLKFGSLPAISTFYSPYQYGDAFVVKYDANGNPLWLKNFGGTKEEVLTGITSDPEGNTILTGHYTSDSLYFDGTSMDKAGGSYTFLIKYNNAGKLLWAKKAGGTSSKQGAVSDRAFGVACDDSGYIYIAGIVNSYKSNFNGYILDNPSGWGQIMLARFDPSGNCKWARATSFGATCSGAIAVGVATYRSQYVYIVCYTLSHDITYLDSLAIKPFSNFMLKANTQGHFLDMVQIEPYATMICTDKQNNVYVGGAYDGGCRFLDDSLPPTSLGQKNLFLAKYGYPVNSVAEQQAGGQVSLYPNPVGDVLYIDAGKDIYTGITILNNMGQVMQRQECNAALSQVDIARLPAGLYLLTLEGPGGRVVKKFEKL